MPRRQPRNEPTPGYAPGSLAWYFSHIPGGVDLALEIIRAAVADITVLADNDPFRPRLLTFLDIWAEQPNRDAADLDHVTRRAKIKPDEMYGFLVRRLYQYRDAALEMLKVVMEPAILSRSYDEALKPTGFADRTALLKQLGHHHAPAGPQINLTQQTVNVTEDRGLPDFDAHVHELHAALRPPQLPAAPVVVDITAGEKEEERYR